MTSPPPVLPDREGQIRAVGPSVAWLVILACVGVIALARAVGDEQPSRDSAPHRIDPQVRIGGRYAVGLHHVLPEPMRREIADAALAQFRREASSPADRLRAAIVVAEIHGAEAALKALDELSETGLDESLAHDARVLRELYADHAGMEVDEADLKDLVERHGWFGSLARSWGETSSSASRAAALAPAKRTAITLLVAVLAGIGLLVAGIAALVVFVVLASLGSLRRSYTPPTQLAGSYVEAFAIYLGVFTLLSVLAAATDNSIVSRILRVGALLAPLAILWPIARGIRWSDWRVAVGWHRGRGMLYEIFAGVIGYVASIPLLVIGFLITFAIMRATGAKPSHPIIQQLSTDPWKILGILLLASVYAPLVEEMMFRGALYHHLRKRWHWFAAAVIVAFIFAAIHPQGFAAVPLLMILAIVFAVMREWRGSLIAPITAHALNNTVVLIFAALVMA